MTEHLRQLAGDRMRSALMRFTRTPLSGAITGASCTAMLQSSSATTVAVVGFVGAGLMSFPNALGIIFGANIGSTATGWVVALLGFKLKLNLIVLPLIFLGVLLKLFSDGDRARWGLALAGFGLIFVGIGQMQEGMAGLDKIIDFDQLPADTLTGRLKLVGLGIAFTLITQASSAGVAASLTALYAGMIGFQQAAALVIGMDIGTTATALMASIGGSVEMRRTGASHVMYNFMTAILALALIDPYTTLWQRVTDGNLVAHGEIALVAFHTSFNTLGVLLILPFAQHFARLIIRLLPEPRWQPSQHMDPKLLEQPPLALTAIHLRAINQLQSLIHHCQATLSLKQAPTTLTPLPQLQRSLDESQHFLDEIHLAPDDATEWPRLIAQLHGLDHLQRLHERLDEDHDRANVVASSPIFEDEKQHLLQTLGSLSELLSQEEWSQAYGLARQQSLHVESVAENLREAIIDQIGQGGLSTPEGTQLLEAVRWLTRVSIHLARIHYHIQQSVTRSGL